MLCSNLFFLRLLVSRLFRVMLVLWIYALSDTNGGIKRVLSPLDFCRNHFA